MSGEVLFYQLQYKRCKYFKGLRFEVFLLALYFTQFSFYDRCYQCEKDNIVILNNFGY